MAPTPAMRPPDPWIHGRPGDRTDSVDPCEVLARAYESVGDEVDRELEVVEGAIPRELAGTYYKNGPGRVSIGGERYGHPFDGDGMVLRFALAEGRVRYRNRYVRTRELLDEERAGRIVHRGFGTQRPGGLRANLFRLRIKNAANTSVLFHGGALYALWEGGWPHRLDPVSLATIGRDDLDGALAPESRVERALGIEWALCAHPIVCPESGELWAFGGVPGRGIAIHRFDRAGVRLRRRVIDLPRAAFVHDFVLTERYAVLVVPPLAFDLGRAALGLASVSGSLRHDRSAPTSIVIVPRDGGPVRTLDAPPAFSFHHVNGWDDGGSIVIDTLRLDALALELGGLDMLDPEAIRRTRVTAVTPTRMTIDLARGRIDEEPRLHVDAELPTIDPRRRGRPTRYAWAIARPEGWHALAMPAIAKLDLDRRASLVRDLAPDLPGEPLFVPRLFAPCDPSEDDGWLLSVVYRAREHRSELWVLDARDLSTVARAVMPHHVPPGFHGTFVPARSITPRP